MYEEICLAVRVTKKLQQMYIQIYQETHAHPLDGATAHLIRIMTMAAKDIDAMADEKGAEWSGEQQRGQP